MKIEINENPKSNKVSFKKRKLDSRTNEIPRSPICNNESKDP